MVFLPFPYATWDAGICFSHFSPIMQIMQTAKIFLRMKRRMIDQRFSAGPIGFPVICEGARKPSCSSCWYSLVMAAWFSRSAMWSRTMVSFSCFALIPSFLARFLFLRSLIAFSISLWWKVVCISTALITSSMAVMFSEVNVFQK